MNANVTPGWRAIITLCGIAGALLDLALGLVMILAACFSLYALCFVLFTGQGWPPAVRAFAEPATQAMIMTVAAVSAIAHWAKTGERRR